ncbi:MAG: hypothetical protein P1U56_20290 [Saprospiraceae bacterium]|nr:hypothetical protein [Saprospiraceae bacterium]
MSFYRLFILSFVLPILVLSCKTSSSLSQQSAPQIIDEELRIYDIKSSMEATVYLLEKHGEWQTIEKDPTIEFKRYFIWENVDLRGDGLLYTIRTGGVETMKEYYTSISLFDKNGHFPLSSGTPSATLLKEYLISELKKNRNKGKLDSYLKVKNSY